MNRIFVFLFIAVSGLELGGLFFHIPLLTTIAKPLIVLALVGYYLTRTSQRSVVFLAGLGFCWAGDVLLMLDGELFFMLGLVAFLLGHVFYILAYRQHSYADSTEGLLNTQKIRFSLPILLAGTGLVVVLQPKLGALQLPVMIYAVVIIIMVMNALFRFGKTSPASFWMVFGGALLFQVSDSVLAVNKFHSAIAMGNFWIMLTYIAAQGLIVRGITEH